MIYTGQQITVLFNENCDRAASLLAALPIYCSPKGSKPRFKGLSGWVFEQVVQNCIKHELAARHLTSPFQEQWQLNSHVFVDLLVGNMLIEIKCRGCFSKKDSYKYAGYRRLAKEKGKQFLFVTQSETYEPYRDSIRSTMGDNNAYFINVPGDWERFINRIELLISEPPREN